MAAVTQSQARGSQCTLRRPRCWRNAWKLLFKTALSEERGSSAWPCWTNGWRSVLRDGAHALLICRVRHLTSHRAQWQRLPRYSSNSASTSSDTKVSTASGVSPQSANMSVLGGPRESPTYTGASLNH